MTNPSTNQADAATFRSGTAARLAGIPVATLRMWERRYGVVGPQVSARGHRRYGREEVSRLALIKSLVDLGHPIGSIAQLPTEALHELRTTPAAVVAPARQSAPAAPLRVALVGETLTARAANRAQHYAQLQVVASCADRAQAPVALRGVAADVLAIELPALREDAMDSIDALAATVGARRAVIGYRFGTEAAIRELRRRGHAVTSAPLDLAAIEAFGSAEGAHPAAPTMIISAPLFDEHALAALAQVSTTVRCECPKHVADLLLSLGAFERYSAECENRSPEDAELHRYLGRVAGSARSLFEEALVRVAQAEGIALPTVASTETG